MRKLLLIVLLVSMKTVIYGMDNNNNTLGFINTVRYHHTQNVLAIATSNYNPSTNKGLTLLKNNSFTNIKSAPEKVSFIDWNQHNDQIACASNRNLIILDTHKKKYLQHLDKKTQ